jgi:hypothetical protein
VACAIFIGDLFPRGLALVAGERRLDVPLWIAIKNKNLAEVCARRLEKFQPIGLGPERVSS